MNMPDWVEELVRAGIEVTITKRGYDNLKDDGVERIYFDLHSGAKSGMYLYNYEDNGKWYIDMRYGQTMEVETLDDVMTAFLDCYYIRNVGSSEWLEFLVSKGRLKKTVIEQKPIIKYE